MYTKEGTLLDRREMLRVKVKSLAEEARIIRREEQRTWGAFRTELHQHRVLDVRRAARNAHLAYGLIRGRSLEEMEESAHWRTLPGYDSGQFLALGPNWGEVGRLIKKYGAPGDFDAFNSMHNAMVQAHYTGDFRIKERPMRFERDAQAQVDVIEGLIDKVKGIFAPAK